MILGHGIDLQDIDQISKAFERNPRFACKVLTEREHDYFESLKGQKRINFLAGRWAAKEAFSKAWGTGIGQLRFQDLEVMADDKGAPVFTKHPFKGRVLVSISHTANLVQASVILEERDDC